MVLLRNRKSLVPTQRCSDPDWNSIHAIGSYSRLLQHFPQRVLYRKSLCCSRTHQVKSLSSLQVASCIYRIALGPRAGQQVLSLRTVAGRDEKNTTDLCAAAQGFSLHAALRCGAHQRKELERLCRTITRPAIAN